MITISAKNARPSSNNLPKSKLSPIYAKSRALAVGLVSVTLDSFALHDHLRDHGFARGGHDLLLGDVRSELRRYPAATHHDDPVRDAQTLGDFGGRKHHGESLRGALAEQPEHFGLGADVDAAIGLIEQDDLGAGRQHLADDDFLLVAARQRSDRRARRLRS